MDDAGRTHLPVATPEITDAASPSHPRDFGELARRISSRTTDLLAIGILIAGGLAVGGSLMTWWRSEPPVAIVPAAPAAPWSDPGGVELQFGQTPWSIRRESVTAEPEAARDLLLERMRGAVAAASGVALPPPDEAELRLLAELRQWSPHETSSTGRLYVIGGPLLWMVGTSGANLAGSAEAADRVICWGLALPQADESWTLYVIDRRAAAHAAGESAEFPLPEGARRSLRIAGESGDELTCFSGAGPAGVWIGEFDLLLEKHGWTRTREWVRDGRSAAAEFRRSGKGLVEMAGITLLQDELGVWRGVIDVSRKPAQGEDGFGNPSHDELSEQ